MNETDALRDYEQQMLDLIEGRSSNFPILRNPILDRVINPDDYGTEDDYE